MKHNCCLWVSVGISGSTPPACQCMPGVVQADGVCTTFKHCPSRRMYLIFSFSATTRGVCTSAATITGPTQIQTNTIREVLKNMLHPAEQPAGITAQIRVSL